MEVADEPWLVLAEQRDALKHLTHDQLVMHLAVQGWVPVVGMREALQRGRQRVNIVERGRGLSVTFYEHFKELKRDEVPWPTNTARLRMLADRIVVAMWNEVHGVPA